MIKNKIKLTSSYFCFLKKFKQGIFFYSNNKNFFYTYGNLVVFFIEKMVFQLLKIIYLSLDVLKKGGTLLFLINSLFKGTLLPATQAYILADWIPGTFLNKAIVWWTYLKYNLPLIFKKPALAFFFKASLSNYTIAQELHASNIPIVSPTFSSKIDLLIDYPLYLNKSLYSLYFFFCILLKLLCKK